MTTFVENLDHQGGPILRLTDEGTAVDDAISDRHARWSNQAARKLDERKMKVALDAIQDLLACVEDSRRMKSRKTGPMP